MLDLEYLEYEREYNSELLSEYELMRLEYDIELLEEQYDYAS